MEPLYEPFVDGINEYESTWPIDEPLLPQVLPSSSDYSPDYGHGCVNAADAIAVATGQSPLPDVPDLDSPTNLNQINVPEVHQQGYTGEGTTVAIIDTGIDLTHPDLQDQIWINSGEISGNGIDDDGNGYIDDIHGVNVANPSEGLVDERGHGTHVAGIVAAVAPDAKIMPVKVDHEGVLTSENIAQGIRFAANEGADVINISLGGDFNADIEAAIRYAEEKGCTVVMAAGNEGAATPTFPANMASDIGIAVGAIDSNGQIADFSNRAGDEPIQYVVAPGVQIRSTIPGGDYASYDGTSMAAPHVAGVAALIKSANPDLTSAEIEDIIAQTANPHMAEIALPIFEPSPKVPEPISPNLPPEV